jgi:ribonuclease P protein component
MNFKLPKNERIHSKKSIKELFDKGSSFFLYPFKVLFLKIPEGQDGTYQVLFSVSKKKIKRAVDRNFVKRRMKEAYRLNKHLLSKDEDQKKLIAIIYVSKELSGFQDLEIKMQKVLKRL